MILSDNNDLRTGLNTFWELASVVLGESFAKRVGVKYRLLRDQVNGERRQGRKDLNASYLADMYPITDPSDKSLLLLNAFALTLSEEPRLGNMSRERVKNFLSVYEPLVSGSKTFADLVADDIVQAGLVEKDVGFLDVYLQEGLGAAVSDGLQNMGFSAKRAHGAGRAVDFL